MNTRLAEMVERVKPTQKSGPDTWVLVVKTDGKNAMYCWETTHVVRQAFKWDAEAAVLAALVGRMKFPLRLTAPSPGAPTWVVGDDHHDKSRIGEATTPIDALYDAFLARPDLFTEEA